jgi:peptidoglycan/LPS O-acetylase OafA/YrhL
MRTRRGALDGLRAVALAAVLIYHALPGALPGGFLGVEVFFVLSGYLLTTILLAEHRRDGRVDWRRYAARRVRRLAPALLALLAVLVLVVPIVAADDAHRFAGDLFSSLTGVTNWHLIRDHSSYFAAMGRPPLVRHLWSLSVEIQFYVLCPFLVAWIVRHRTRIAVVALGGGVGASAMVMALLYRAADPSRAYYGTDARIGAMLAGALVAVVLAGHADPAPRRRRRVVATAAGYAGLLGLGVLFVVSHERARLLYPLGFLATQLATALVIAQALRPGRLGSLLAARRLRWLGERSYGIYLWHWPLVALMRPRIDVAWSPGFAAVLTIAGAVALGHLSYGLLERPFLVSLTPTPTPRRGRLVVGVEWSLALVATAGLAVLVTDLPTADPIVSSLRAGQKVVSRQTDIPTTTAAPTPTTTVAPEPAPAAPAEVAPAQPAPSPPPAPVPATEVHGAAIGDSVMLGAAPQLQQRLGPSTFIDAKVSRQFNQGVDVARQLREEGRLGNVVIVHLGTNGPPTNRDVDRMMSQLDGVAHVLVVTVRMPRDWEAATNQTLRSAATRYPSIAIVDWHGHSNGHPEWFESDGVHLRANGAVAYADLLAAAIPPPPPPPTPPTTPPPTTTTTEPPTTTTTGQADVTAPPA